MTHAMVTVICFSMTSILLNINMSQEIARNSEYGITLPVPDGTLYCPPSKNVHSHGPVLLLGSRDLKNCSPLDENSRYIGVFASGNAVIRTKTLSGFLKYWACNNDQNPCIAAPKDLNIRGMPSMAARVNRSNGWIDISVVTQAGKPDPAFDATVPSINYYLGLHTNPEHLEEDLRIFRVVLQTIKISPPN